MPKGVRLSAADLGLGLRHLPSDGHLWSMPPFATSVRSAVAMYAVEDLEPGQPIGRHALSAYAPRDVSAGSAVVSVEVKSDHAQSVGPGTWVAFAKEDALLPEPNHPGHTAFHVLSVTIS